MGNGNTRATLPLTRHVVEHRLWGERPLCVIDVGASGGIHSRWRVFSGQLRAIGFDPLVTEIERLNRKEADPAVRYEAAYVTCRDFDERFPPDVRSNRSITKTNDHWLGSRLSARRAQQLEQQKRQQSYIQQVFNSGEPIVLTDRRITLDEYLRSSDVEQVDFVKIDTDGHDIEVLLGADGLLSGGSVLGVSVEAQFHGAIHEYANTFTNVDRFMRAHGFTLFDLEPCRYSRAALPAPFVYDLAAQTCSGQVSWSDALYFRDLGDPEYESLWSDPITAERVLKLACLFELFNLPDCAAELLVNRGSVLPPGVSDQLLDLLVDGAPGSYRDYVGRFEHDYTQWFPRNRNDARSDTPPIESGISTNQASVAKPNEFDRLRQRVAELKKEHTMLRKRLHRAGRLVRTSDGGDQSAV